MSIVVIPPSCLVLMGTTRGRAELRALMPVVMVPALLGRAILHRCRERGAAWQRGCTGRTEELAQGRQGCVKR